MDNLRGAYLSSRASHVRSSVNLEVLLIVAIFLAFLLLNLSTAALYPLPWQDEVMFLDPAANLYLGNGFTSSAYPFERRDELHLARPLHGVLLAGWIKLFGLNIHAVRSLNYVLTLLGVGMIWLGVKRYALIPTPGYRIALVATLLLGYGMSFIYRSGRIEPLMVVLVAAAFLVCSIDSRARRLWLLGALGVLAPIAGEQLVAFAVIFGAALFIYVGNKALPELASIMVGIAIAVVGSYLLRSTYGALGNPIDKVAHYTSTGLVGVMLGRGEFSHQNTIPKDPSLVVSYVLLWILFLYDIGQRRFKRESILSFAFMFSLLVPIGLIGLAKFPTYYAWMVFVPLTVCIVSYLSRSEVRPFVKSISLTLLVFMSVVGLPMQLAVASYNWRDRDYAVVEAMVATEVKGDDWVLCDYSAYYAIKRKAAVVFLPGYVKVMSEEERRNISILVLSPKQRALLGKEIGGDWREVGTGIGRKGSNLLERIIGSSPEVGLLNQEYELQMYRRN